MVMQWCNATLSYPAYLPGARVFDNVAVLNHLYYLARFGVFDLKSKLQIYVVRICKTLVIIVCELNFCELYPTKC